MEPTEMAPDATLTQADSSQSNGATSVEPVALPGKPVNPWAPDEGRCVSLKEYWSKWHENTYPDIDVSYEWNNGILEAKPSPNAPQLELYNWFLDLLRRYLNTHGIAKLINLESGFVLTMTDPAEPSGQRVQVRKPDVGLILNSNPVSWGDIDQRHFDGACDMVVEAVSDSTQAEALRDPDEKRRDYALAGVKEYTILDPCGLFDCRQGPADGVGDNQNMRFYRLTAAGHYEEIPLDAEGVIRSELLHGFQFRHDDLWRQPDLAELALDEVYSKYVIPDLQAAVTRVYQAGERAETEAQRADSEAQARQQAEERAQALEAEFDRLRRQGS